MIEVKYPSAIAHLVSPIGLPAGHLRVAGIKTQTAANATAPEIAFARKLCAIPACGNRLVPETRQTAVEVLEATGFHVVMQAGEPASGRTVYDSGMLDLAK